MPKLELKYGGDRGIIVGGAIAPGVIVRMTAADIHIDYKLRYCTGHRTESKSTSVWGSCSLVRMFNNALHPISRYSHL